MDNKKDRWWAIISSVSKRVGKQAGVLYSSMKYKRVGEGNVSSI
jgi:hypothetical protein